MRPPDRLALIGWLLPIMFAALIAGRARADTPDTGLMARLESALVHYRALERAGGWPRVPAGPALRLGSEDERVAALRRRLIIGGDLREFAISEHFDDALDAAVKRFQRRHGLGDDGIVGPATLAALNVPVHRRVDQLRLSIDRAGALPDDRSAYLWVNTAAASAELVIDGRTQWRGRSIVGRREHPTPDIHSALDRVVLNPYWLVPARIAEQALAPRVMADPAYLSRQRYIATDASGQRLDPTALDWRNIATAIDSGQVRLMQRPGPGNALGKVKFLFPNRHAIYLHDTPNRQHFSRAGRALSNGCVRVESAESLAELLLTREGWAHEDVNHALASGRARVARLSQAPSVHLVYLTAVPGPGGVHFYPDRYGRDTPMALAALD